MKICAAQIKAVTGNIRKNIEHHIEFIDLATKADAAIIIFPELSLTGYEPTLATHLAIDISDNRLDIFQQRADAANMVIAVGAPVKLLKGISIGMVIFEPGKMRQLYSKQFLHEDEYPFFSPGYGGPNIIIGNNVIALAICYELSVQEHAENAFRNGANLYLASVSKTMDGMEKAYQFLSTIAASYAVPAVICNSVGYCDNFESAGRSAAWNKNGNLLSHLDNTHQSLLVVEIDS